MRALIVFMFAGLFLALPASAAVDLRMSAGDIRFSKTTLVAGDEVRIYATIYNDGDEDVSGYVSFYQGAAVIGDSVVISLLAGGNPEEVYIDFVVPSGTFNILAKIQGTDPQDERTDNNEAITGMLQPLQDDDRDGIANQADNCPSAVNASQSDADGDGDGDNCDSDDDNDGLSDEVEIELGTSSTSADTDGDGITDAEDVYPRDPARFAQNDTMRESVPPSTPSTSDALAKIVQEVARAIQESSDADEPGDQDDSLKGMVVAPLSEDTRSPEEIHVSPNAVFRYTRNAWSTFFFEVLSNASDSTVSIWDFGDGGSSSKTSVSHIYATSGAFYVTLTMTDSSGVASSESTTILVPFFHLGNPLVLASVIALVLLLVVGVASVIRLGRKSS